MNSILLPTGYAAPECYDNEWTRKSDIFSFGVIMYELLVGEPAFSRQFGPYKYMHEVVIEKTRPFIPYSILPEMRELIQDCWSDHQDIRPSFESILNFLEKNKFKITQRVNQSKVIDFVEGLKAWEVSQESAIDAANAKPLP
jgi:serine/threonine protein kinase